MPPPQRIVLVVYVGLIGLTGFGFSRAPTGFIPMQDKGYLVTNIQLPDSASLERTLEVTDAVEKIALETPGVAHTLCLPGMSYVLNANSSNYSNVFIILSRSTTSATLARRDASRQDPRRLARGTGGPCIVFRRADLRPRHLCRLQADGGGYR
jgi:multidrug efflux pump subunit AcrB